MADKSPRQHMSKKPAKSIKEKRAEKQAKSAAQNQVASTLPDKKR